MRKSEQFCLAVFVFSVGPRKMNCQINRYFCYVIVV